MARSLLLRVWNAVAPRSIRGCITVGAVFWIAGTAFAWMVESGGSERVTMWAVALGGLACLLAVAAAVLAWGTLRRNRWGINTGDVICPRCHTRLPLFREPKTARQFLWGGGTCSGCGAEIDKWGHEVGSSDGGKGGHVRGPTQPS